MSVIIDGNSISRLIRQQVKTEVLRIKETGAAPPGLAVILVGEDPASNIYVNRKKNACEEVGFLSFEFRLPQSTTESHITGIINDLNRDERVHGVLVQLPLPGHINTSVVVETLNPLKDVDGFHPYNMGRLFTGNPYHMACTPKGILKMLDYHGIEIAGKEAVIVGRSNIVGKPLAMMLLNRHATISICHTKTARLSEVTKRGDILIAAAGQPDMIQKDMVKSGAVVIDVGINRTADGRLIGDVAFAEVREISSYITPVPGGVGPMTIAMLLENTLAASKMTR